MLRRIIKESLEEAMWEPSTSDEGLALIELFYPNSYRELLLINESGNVYGMISYALDGDFALIGSSYGLHGYGAFMYEAAMINIYPRFLSSSLFTNTESRAVWDKYYQRGDVEKEFSPWHYKSLVQSYGKESADERVSEHYKYRKRDPDKIAGILLRGEEVFEKYGQDFVKEIRNKAKELSKQAISPK